MRFKNWKKTFPGRLIVFTVCFLLVTLLFYWVVADDWRRTAVTTETVNASAVVPTDESASRHITQEFRTDIDRLLAVSLLPARTSTDPGDHITLRLYDADKLLWELAYPCASLQIDQVNEFEIPETIEDVRGKTLVLDIDVSGTGISFWRGTSVTAGRVDVDVETIGELKSNDLPVSGQLVMTLRGEKHLGAQTLVWPIAGVIYLACVFLMGMYRHQQKTGKTNLVGKVADVVTRYSFLLKTLVKGDFRIKYQASILGFLWSFLNPLLTMFVYLLVFSTIFKNNIENFPLYLITGIVLFNFYSESTNQGLISIVSNRALITKVYMPKYIYPLAKVLSSAVNLMISFIPMFLVMIVTGVPIHRSMLLLPLVLLFLVLFSAGMSMILATMNVFFRDTEFLWGILIMVWNFLTPIFYPESIIPASFRTVYHLNPLYQIVYFMRSITIGGVSPTPITYLYCFIASFVPFVLGVFVMKRKQDQFVLHL